MKFLHVIQTIFVCLRAYSITFLSNQTQILMSAVCQPEFSPLLKIQTSKFSFLSYLLEYIISTALCHKIIRVNTLSTSDVCICLYLYLFYLYLCICICAFVFVYLYLCIYICVFVLSKNFHILLVGKVNLSLLKSITNRGTAMQTSFCPT